MEEEKVETSDSQGQKPEEYKATVSERARRLVFGINDPEKAQDQALRVQDKRDKITAEINVLGAKNKKLEERVMGTRDSYLVGALINEKFANSDIIQEKLKARKKTI